MFDKIDKPFFKKIGKGGISVMSKRHCHFFGRKYVQCIQCVMHCYASKELIKFPKRFLQYLDTHT
jgi:hypothetical protein